MRSGMALLATLVVGFMAAGCFETETPLAPPGEGFVDAKLVGDWEIKGDDGKPCDVTVRNFDGHQLYVEMRESGKLDRYAAHITVLKGASFAQLRPLTDDGTIETEHIVMRVDRAGDDKVSLRQLKSEFFGDKPHDSSEKLRAIIEQNVNNAEMYDGDPIPMTRKAD